MNKTGAVIQARTTSTRLPGKVLKELPFASGITVLEQVIRRVKKSKRISQIIVATTEEPIDEAILAIAKKAGVTYFRGSKEDVLSRYYLAARENNLQAVVRVTSDCPCVDHNILDMLIDVHSAAGADYTTNSSTETFPHGSDAEIISFSALEKAHKEANLAFEREHVCPYIYRTHPEMFKIKLIEAQGKLRRHEIRITLDTPEDYALLCCVFDELYRKNEFFLTEEIIDLFDRKPWLPLINNKIIQKKIFDTLSEEVRESIAILGLQDLKRASAFLKDAFEKNSDINRGR